MPDAAGTLRKAANPQPVADDGDALAVSLILLLKEVAAEFGLHTQHAEVVGGDRQSRQMVRPASCSKVVVNLGVTRDVLEQPRIFAQPQELPHVETCTLRLIFVRFNKLDDAIGLRKGQRAEQYAIDHSEDGGVSPNAEGQGEDSHGGEAGSFSQSAKAEAEVLPQGFHGRPSAMLVRG